MPRYAFDRLYFYRKVIWLAKGFDRLCWNHAIENVDRRRFLIEWLYKRWLALLCLTEVSPCAGVAVLDSKAEHSNIKDLLHPLAHPNLIVSFRAVRLRGVMQAHQCWKVQVARPRPIVYKSWSSSSGRGIAAASVISFWYASRVAWSTVTSGGARAGAATNSRVLFPTNFRASHRNGFSKL